MSHDEASSAPLGSFDNDRLFVALSVCGGMKLALRQVACKGRCGTDAALDKLKPYNRRITAINEEMDRRTRDAGIERHEKNLAKAWK